MDKKHIAVIGGGYTGLVAALRLSQSGFNVTILEREKFVGGLASNFIVEGASLERAYHHIFKTDTSIINMAKELQVDSSLKWYDSSVSIYYGNQLHAFKGALDLLKFKPLTFINRLRAGLVAFYLQKKKEWAPFSKFSALEWMTKYSGKQVTKVIWEPLLRGKFDKYYNKVSMSWLGSRLHIRSGSREAGGEKLGYFLGGFQIFTDALVKKLIDSGVNIQTQSSVDCISNNTNNKVCINFADGTSQIFDACIATTPTDIFSKLVEKNNLPAEYLEKLGMVKYIGVRLCVFSSTQNICDFYWNNINDIEVPFLVFINHTKLIEKKYYNGKYIYYIAAYLPHDSDLFNCSEVELEALWFDSLKKMFPHFDITRINEKHMFKFKNAQHIVDTKYSNYIPKYETPLANVYLSNFSQIYPEDRGTNHSVREGEKIAKLVTQDLITSN